MVLNQEMAQFTELVSVTLSLIWVVVVQFYIGKLPRVLPDDPKCEGLNKRLFQTYTWRLSENTHLFHQRHREERAKLGANSTEAFI